MAAILSWPQCDNKALVEQNQILLHHFNWFLSMIGTQLQWHLGSVFSNDKITIQEQEVFKYLRVCPDQYNKFHDCICSTGPFQFRWSKGYIHSSCYYHHQIEGINLTHCYHIFPWLCTWDVCYIISCHLLHIHSGPTGILFSLLLCSLWWVQIVRYVLANRSYSFGCTLHHLIIIIVQTYLKTLNSLSYPLYTIWGCVFSVYPFPLWWLREYTLCLIFIIKSEIWIIIHCLGLGHETMVCAVCLSLILLKLSTTVCL